MTHPVKFVTLLPTSVDSQDTARQGRHTQRDPSVTAIRRLNQPFWRDFARFCLWTAVFGVAFTQWPLYSENQNTKFLIGLARAGLGVLGDDWLANTIDPLPVFSALVYLTYRFLHPNLFYLYHTLLLGIYLWSVGEIVASVFPLKKRPVGVPLFYVAVIALHASLLPPFSLEVMGTSLGWLLQAGVANQYLFNPVFQPSTFGVLLILSISLFLRDRPYWAASAACGAAVLHSTYLPAAAVLVLAYSLLALWDERTLRKPFLIGALALALVLPVLLYNAIALGPTNADLWAQSQDIIVNFRIPHHSLPEQWLDNTVYVKLAIVLLALLLVVRTRLFPILLVSTLVAVGLTLLQMRIGWDTLAFIAPWRISVYLVPLSTTLVIGYIMSLILGMFPMWTEPHRLAFWALCLCLLAVLVGRGVIAMRASVAARAQSAEAPLWRFARETRQPGDLYLVPTEMAEFRLATGVPVVVTFKSHPYKDVEVIEWRNRVEMVNGYYNQPNCAGLAEMVGRYGVTHVVLRREQFFNECDRITNIHLDDRYGVFRLNEAREE